MPEYEYRCACCEHEFSVNQNIKKYKPKKQCPECKKHGLERVISPPNIFVRGEAQTIGQLAERNTKSMGHYELSDARGRQDEGNFKKKGEGPWHHSTGTATPAEINRMSDTQKYRYVRTGKK
jgi:putative FmdB family regulatory protein